MKSDKIVGILKIIFLTSAILDVFGLAFHWLWLEIISKPMIVLSLIALYVVSAKKKKYDYLFALLFSFLGDIFLLDKDGYFLLGIGSFLITQILFIKIIRSQLKRSNLKQKVTSILPFIIYLILLITVLWDSLGEFLIPVIIYGFTISVFGMLSLLNHLLSKTPKSRLLLFGALLFIVSDSLIAFHKFHEPVIIYPIAIMVTYILAQYLIYNFMIKMDISNK